MVFKTENPNYPCRKHAYSHNRVYPAVSYAFLWISFTYSISILLAHASVFARGLGFSRGVGDKENAGVLV